MIKRLFNRLSNMKNLTWSQKLKYSIGYIIGYIKGHGRGYKYGFIEGLKKTR